MELNYAHVVDKLLTNPLADKEMHDLQLTLGSYWSTFSHQKNAFNLESYSIRINSPVSKLLPVFRMLNEHKVGILRPADDVQPARFYVSPGVSLVKLGLQIVRSYEFLQKKTQPSTYIIKVPSGEVKITLPPNITQECLLVLTETFMDDKLKVLKR